MGALSQMGLQKSQAVQTEQNVGRWPPHQQLPADHGAGEWPCWRRGYPDCPAGFWKARVPGPSSGLWAARCPQILSPNEPSGRTIQRLKAPGRSARWASHAGENARTVSPPTAVSFTDGAAGSPDCGAPNNLGTRRPFRTPAKALPGPPKHSLQQPKWSEASAGPVASGVGFVRIRPAAHVAEAVDTASMGLGRRLGQRFPPGLGSSGGPPSVRAQALAEPQPCTCEGGVADEGDQPPALQFQALPSTVSGRLVAPVLRRREGPLAQVWAVLRKGLLKIPQRVLNKFLSSAICHLDSGKLDAYYVPGTGHMLATRGQQNGGGFSLSWGLVQGEGAHG